MAGERVVRELLEEILDEVCHAEPLDIAVRGRELKEVCVEKKAEGPHFDLCSAVRKEHPNRVLANFSLRRVGVEVLHLQCAEQQASGYCGHYALYFGLCCLEACQSICLPHALGYLSQAWSVAGFWRRYWLSIEGLLRRVSVEEDWWPWTEDHVLSGDMERSYLSHLLHCDSHVRALRGQHNIHVLHYAYGCIQNSEAQVCELQRQIECFQREPAPSHLVFILGVTNHWVTLMAYKAAPPVRVEADRTVGLGRRIGLLYLDSNNVPVLTASNGDILQIIQKKEAERVKRKGRGYSEWKRGVIFQAFVDQREVVGLLARVLCGEADLRSELLSAHWGRVLDSYEQHVGTSEDMGQHMALLLQWLESHYRPQTLRDTHVALLNSLGVARLSVCMRKRLSMWIHGCHCLLQSLTSGIDLIEQFSTVVSQLVLLLQWKH